MIALACDHGALDLKKAIMAHLDKRGLAYKDFGCYTKDSCDYPDFAGPAAQAVASGECDRGIVCCTTGIGVSITANKVKGIRCALLDNPMSARLTRQQSRDSALSLLKEASENQDVDAETASEAAKSIETLASYTLSEAQIENMVTAKGYEDCVVFMSEDGVSVVVSTGEEGLQTEDIARITDIVKQETGLSAESIKIMEVN